MPLLYSSEFSALVMVSFPMARLNNVINISSLLSLILATQPSFASPLYDFPYGEADFLIKDTDIDTTPLPNASVSIPSSIIDRFAIDPRVESDLLPFDSLLLPKPYNYLRHYQRIDFEGQSFACLSLAESVANSILSRRCRPIRTAVPSYVYSYSDVILRSITASPKVSASLSDIRSKVWLLRESFSSWYPNLSVSSGSILLTNITNTQNYGEPSPSSNPSVSGTAFQPSDPVSTTSDSSASSSSQSGSTTNGIDPAYTQYSSYVQAYPVLTLTWSFLDPTRSSKIQAAKYAVSSAEFDAQSNARNVAFNASSLYTQLLVQEYSISGYLAQLIASSKILSIYENQFTDGYISLNRLVSQRASVQQDKYNLDQAVLKFNSAYMQLLPLLGLRPSAYDLFFPQSLQLPNKWPLSLQKTETLIEGFPSILSSLEQSKQYLSLADSARKSYYPTLSLLGYMTYVGTLGSESYFPPSQPQGAWSSQLSSYIGLNMTWNIFDGFSQFNQANSYQAQANSYAQSANDDLLQSVSKALSDISTLNSALPAIQSLSKSYQLSLDAISLLQQRVSIGYEDPVDLFQSEYQAGQLISDFSELYSDVLTAFVDLLQVTGMQLDPQFIDPPDL